MLARWVRETRLLAQHTGVPATSLDVYQYICHYKILQIFEDNHTTVSVTNGVGVQPRGGVRSKEGVELEKGRKLRADWKRETVRRGTDRPSR